MQIKGLKGDFMINDTEIIPLQNKTLVLTLLKNSLGHRNNILVSRYYLEDEEIPDIEEVIVDEVINSCQCIEKLKKYHGRGIIELSKIEGTTTDIYFYEDYYILNFLTEEDITYLLQTKEEGVNIKYAHYALEKKWKELE